MSDRILLFHVPLELIKREALIFALLRPFASVAQVRAIQVVEHDHRNVCRKPFGPIRAS